MTSRRSLRRQKSETGHDDAPNTVVSDPVTTQSSPSIWAHTAKISTFFWRLCTFQLCIYFFFRLCMDVSLKVHGGAGQDDLVIVLIQHSLIGLTLFVLHGWIEYVLEVKDDGEGFIIRNLQLLGLGLTMSNMGGVYQINNILATKIAPFFVCH